MNLSLQSCCNLVRTMNSLEISHRNDRRDLFMILRHLDAVVDQHSDTASEMSRMDDLVVLFQVDPPVLEWRQLYPWLPAETHSDGSRHKTKNKIVPFTTH